MQQQALLQSLTPRLSLLQDVKDREGWAQKLPKVRRGCWPLAIDVHANNLQEEPRTKKRVLCALPQILGGDVAGLVEESRDDRVRCGEL